MSVTAPLWRFCVIDRLSMLQTCLLTELLLKFLLMIIWYMQLNEKQESLAIAKMTARCALYMGTCPENFRESVSRPTVTFPEIFNRLLFRAILWMCVQNLKFLALPVPEIIGGIQKLGSPWIRPRPVVSKFFMAFCSDWACKCSGQIWRS